MKFCSCFVVLDDEDEVVDEAHLDDESFEGVPVEADYVEEEDEDDDDEDEQDTFVRFRVGSVPQQVDY